MHRMRLTCVGILLLMFGCFRECSGHGRLLEPPGRSSLWRYPDQFPDAPVNNDDNGLNCGGQSYQHNTAGGVCGVCGDPWVPDTTEPGPNEAGGRYANGVLARHYKRRDVINVTVELTASHKGYFEFRICSVNDKTITATHECLNDNLLHLADGSQKFYYGSAAGRYYPRVQLPDGLICNQCVFQWRWRAGNSWGYEPSGEGCVGCGPQEEFYACSDISIVDDVIKQPGPVTEVSTDEGTQTTSGHVTKGTATANRVTPTSTPHMTSDTTRTGCFTYSLLLIHYVVAILIRYVY